MVVSPLSVVVVVVSPLSVVVVVISPLSVVVVVISSLSVVDVVVVGIGVGVGPSPVGVVGIKIDPSNLPPPRPLALTGEFEVPVKSVSLVTTIGDLFILLRFLDIIRI